MKPFPTFLGLCLLVGCAVGPDYRRPETAVPDQYRDRATNTPATQVGTSLTWSTLLTDTNLQQLLGRGLTNNYDLRIASARVLQARASLGIARSEYFPNIAAGGNLTTARVSQRGPSAPPNGVNPEFEYGGVALGMATYEVDLWGRIRRSNEAARARLLASEEGRTVVTQSVLAEIAATYFSLIELDAEREIAQQSYLNRTNSLRLVTVRENGGVASLQDVRQSEVLVHAAKSTQIDIERRRSQTENDLRLLLGLAPGEIPRGRLLADQTSPLEIPTGLPSDLLLNRPDIRQAEQQLIAANADVGQARAAYFPQITLTGNFGYQSLSLSDLFTSPARVWQFGPSVSLPLFTGGKIRAQNRLAEARFEEALATYQKTVESAFRDVSNALVGYQKAREFEVDQLALTLARRDAARLADIRYVGGVTSYLELLYNEQESLSAELVLAQARRNILQSIVQLYRALGGGPL